MTDIYINNVKLPPVDKGGLTITPHKLWGANAGRAACTGDMVGDIVAIKTDLALSWSNVSLSDFEIINNAVNTMTPFFSVTYCPDETSGYITKQFYASDPVYGVKSCIDDNMVYGSVTVTLIEQ